MDWFDCIKVSNIPLTSSPQLLQKALFLTAKKQEATRFKYDGKLNKNRMAILEI
jgi:hypothetical protein